MQQRTRVKICGLTSVNDALLAVNYGADAIGMVFYEPSPRHVELPQAAKISRQIPAFVTKTALFVNAEKEFIQRVLAEVDIDLLQFHGDESPEFCQQFNRPYIKAIRMQQATDLTVLAKQYQTASALLLDTYKPGVPGGTGEQFNWQWVPEDFAMPLILAGGLTADNVKQAITAVKPYAVDVSGGVEASKGIKSEQKIQQFMQQVS